MKMSFECGCSRQKCTVERFGFGEALIEVVEVDLPAPEGPGATDEERALLSTTERQHPFL
jgi:hypothetical protein